MKPRWSRPEPVLVRRPSVSRRARGPRDVSTTTATWIRAAAQVDGQAVAEIARDAQATTPRRPSRPRRRRAPAREQPLGHAQPHHDDEQHDQRRRDGVHRRRRTRVADCSHAGYRALRPPCVERAEERLHAEPAESTTVAIVRAKSQFAASVRGRVSGSDSGIAVRPRDDVGRQVGEHEHAKERIASAATTFHMPFVAGRGARAGTRCRGPTS